MKRQIIKAIKNPGYAIHVFSNRYSLTEKLFSHSQDYRSDSENGAYAKAVVAALQNQKAFDNFKRSYSYQEILEHVTFEQGTYYLDILRKRNDGLLEKGLATVLVDDQVGNPVKHRFPDIDIELSPTTLRYLKVASDLKGLFGTELGNVAEIGCGYGGQAYVNDQLLNVDLATLFDLPFVNRLIDRYLNAHLLNGAYRTTVINKSEPRKYDLVISNYAFSELPAILQQTYIRKVVASSAKGYLTMNSGIGGPHSEGKLSLDDLRKQLPDFQIYEEEPITSSHNYILVWGHDTNFASEHLKQKTV